MKSTPKQRKKWREYRHREKAEAAREPKWWQDKRRRAKVRELIEKINGKGKP